MLRTSKTPQKSQKKSLQKPTKTLKRTLTTTKIAKKSSTLPTKRSLLAPTSIYKFSTDASSTTTKSSQPITTPVAPRQEEEIDLLAEAPIIYTNRDLTRAAHLGDVLLLKSCLEQQDPKLDVNHLNQFKNTPLIHAIKQRHVKTMQMLIKHGADVNLQDGQKNWPPIFYAIRKNSVSLFRTLMQHNPDIHRTVPGNKTPMSIAAESNCQVTILNDLLDLGFSVEHRDINGKTPMMAISRLGNIKSVEWFLNQGANPITKDKNGRCALDYARLNPDGCVYRLVKTRTNEIRRIHKLEKQEENDAVNNALNRIKQQINETNKIKNPKKINTTVATQ